VHEAGHQQDPANESYQIGQQDGVFAANPVQKVANQESSQGAGHVLNGC